MTDVDVHGRLRHKGEIERAALRQLKKWILYYVEAVRAQHGHGAIARPKRFARVDDFASIPTKNLPAIIVNVPRASEDAERSGDGYWKQKFELGVTSVMAAATMEAARDAGDIYATACWATLMQQPDLGDKIIVCDYIGVDSIPVVGPGEKPRNVYAVEHTFIAEMDHMFTDLLGPVGIEPPDQILDELPELDEVSVEINPSDDPSP